MSIEFAKYLKKDFPELLKKYTLEEIDQFYSSWSEAEYCAGWMMPCQGYVQRAIEFYENDNLLPHETSVRINQAQIDEIVDRVLAGVKEHIRE